MIEISAPQEYSEFIQSHQIVLIHFWAEWNRHDFTMKMILKKIETSFSEGVGFGSVDVDRATEMRQICKDINVYNLPALAYYKNDQHIETATGLGQPIEEKLNLLISKD